MTKQRILEIDALRGIAALAVVFFHFTLNRPQANLGFIFGCMGVDMFFIISGFVIFLTLSKIQDWKGFLWNRFSRLYPAYWFCVTFTTILIIIKNQSIHFSNETNEFSNNILLKYIANMSMLQYYLNFRDIDGSYWTLIIELLFYLFIIVLLLTKALKHIEIIGTFILILCFCYAVNLDNDSVLIKKIIDIMPLIRYFPLFFSGILLYKMQFEKTTAMRLFLLLIAMVIECCIFHRYYIEGTTAYTCGLVVIYSIFLIYLAGKLTFIVNPFTNWLGRISYSLYLIHQYISLSLIIKLTTRFHLNFWMSSFITLIIVLALAYSINKYIENPVTAYLRKYSKAQIKQIS